MGGCGAADRALFRMGKSQRGFILAVRRAASEGRRRLLRPVRCDYETREFRGRGGRITIGQFLIALSAESRVSFILPMRELPEGLDVFIDTRRGLGCWLCGAGIDSDDPLDVMELALARAPEGELSDYVLPELLGRHRFKTTRGLDELSRCCDVQGFRYAVTAGGVMVTFVVELEAYQ